MGQWQAVDRGGDLSTAACRLGSDAQVCAPSEAIHLIHHSGSVWKLTKRKSSFCQGWIEYDKFAVGSHALELAEQQCLGSQNQAR